MYSYTGVQESMFCKPNDIARIPALRSVHLPLLTTPSSVPSAIAAFSCMYSSVLLLKHPPRRLHTRDEMKASPAQPPTTLATLPVMRFVGFCPSASIAAAAAVLVKRIGLCVPRFQALSQAMKAIGFGSTSHRPSLASLAHLRAPTPLPTSNSPPGSLTSQICDV